MKISNEERQQRINQIEKENEALKKLNDLSEIRKRVQEAQMTNDQLKVKLLELQIEALRSVLSEFHEVDLYSYTQWLKAQALADVMLVLK